MARLGFKAHYAPGAFDAAAVSALFVQIKATLTASGFQVVLDTATLIDLLPAAHAAGTADDDVPHWALGHFASGASAGINAIAVFGVDRNDPAARLSSNKVVIDRNWLGTPTSELTVWFSADGCSGTWWLVAVAVAVGSPSGYRLAGHAAGVRSRRYPSDFHQGLCARYGLWDHGGNWEVPYARDDGGTIGAAKWTGTWSPLGEGWTHNGIRHPGSPLARQALPQFPNRDGNITACVLGEFLDVMVLTDGYALEEVVVPGWIAFIGNAGEQPFALPAPASFTLL